MKSKIPYILIGICIGAIAAILAVVIIQNSTQSPKEGINTSDADKTAQSEKADVTPSSSSATEIGPAETPEPAQDENGTIVLKAVNDTTVTKTFDLDRDGNAERIDIVTKEYESKLTVSSGEKELFAYEGEFIEFYAADLTGDGKYEFLVQRSDEAFGIISAYRFENGKAEQIKLDMDGVYDNKQYGYIVGVDDGIITFSLRTDLMGTRDWYHNACYDKKANAIVFTPDDYRYPTQDNFYTLKQAVTAEDENGEKIELKAGEKLLPTSSDFKTYIWFTTEQGAHIRMSVEKVDWQYKIGGVLQDDLFEDIGYAG